MLTGTRLIHSQFRLALLYCGTPEGLPIGTALVHQGLKGHESHCRLQHCGLKGHESIAQVLAWVVFLTIALKGRQKIVFR